MVKISIHVWSVGKDYSPHFTKIIRRNNFKVLATEHSFRFEIEGVDVPVIGAMDLIEQDNGGNIIITDFKTASKAYSRDEIDKSLQLTIYYLAAKMNNFCRSGNIITFRLLHQKPRSPNSNSITHPEMKRIFNVPPRKSSKYGMAFRKVCSFQTITSWKCGYCSYKKQCNAWFNQEENIQERVCA